MKKTHYIIIGTACIVAAGIALIPLWRDAAQYRGVVIEPFTVSPDLAQHNYDGVVVARQLFNRISELQTAGGTSTVFGIKAIGADWGNLKVEPTNPGIAETAHQWLRRLVGEEIRIGGRLLHSEQGIAIESQVDQQVVGRVDGADSDLDSLIERTAERVLDTARPYHYAAALTNLGRANEAIAVYARMADSGASALERAVGYGVWSYRLLDRSDYVQAEDKARAAIELAPELGRLYYRLWEVHYNQGRFEDALRDISEAEARLREDPQGIYETKPRLLLRAISECEQRLLSADLQPTRSPCREAAEARNRTAVWQLPLMFALGHSLRAAQEAEVSVDTSQPVPLEIHQTYARRRSEAMGALRLGREDWHAAAEIYARGISDAPSGASVLKPWLAYALARNGDLAGAAAAMTALPAGCYPCLRVSGKIAALKHDWMAAEKNFSEAIRAAPSLPWAHVDWAEMLLAKGDIQGAVLQAREAMKKAPRFADAYTLLGEALVRNGDQAGAIEQFTRAAGLAPDWGRVHINWGMALDLLGRRAEAQRRYEFAESLELTPSERQLLAKKIL